jgi:hypothetical protein
MPRVAGFTTPSSAIEMLVSPIVRIASGNSDETTGWGEATQLRAQLDVTTALGTTPTLDVVIEDSLDGTNWNAVGTFAQRLTAGREVINVTSPFANRLRVRWTVGGAGPSFTFGVIVFSR